MDIVLSSRNKNKIFEFNKLLSDSSLNEFNVLSLDDIGVFFEIEENGQSFEENSLIKASVPAQMGYIGIADDSGLCVDALGGAPGVFSARYAGESCSYESNNRKLLKKLDGVEDSLRTARFVCVMSCVFPENCFYQIPYEYDMTERFPDITGGKRAFCIRGECEGTILREKRGENGFGYDPVFYIPEKRCSFAELSHSEKNEISHRGIALRKFAQVLYGILGGNNADK